MSAAARVLLVGLCIWMACGAASARADGLLPPQPYRYLHPPPALARGNNPPLAGEGAAQLFGPSATGFFHLFTRDAQFGVNLVPRTFTLPASTRELHLRIIPVNVPDPQGLPDSLVADGNAYRVIANALPSGTPVSPKKGLGVVLRWPRIPQGVYVYTAGRWAPVCTPLNWSISADTIFCRASTLGTFLAAIHGKRAASQSASSVGRTVLLVAIVVVVVAAALLAFVITRTGRSRRPTEEQRR